LPHGFREPEQSPDRSRGARAAGARNASGAQPSDMMGAGLTTVYIVGAGSTGTDLVGAVLAGVTPLGPGAHAPSPGLGLTRAGAVDV
jgi:hypothetical protein